MDTTAVQTIEQAALYLQIDAWQTMARDLVGDGGSPNVFFVSQDAIIRLVTTDFNAAYAYWQQIAWEHRESALEDRQNGVICSTERSEFSGRWRRFDDSGSLRAAAR